MTITIQSTPAFVICHGYAHRGEAGYFTGPLDEGRTSAKWNAPRKRPIRSAVAAPIDRGLAEHVYDLTVQRIFESEDAATLYRMALPDLMPRGENDIVIDADEAGAGTHNDTVLEAIDILQVGVELTITFLFATAGFTPEED
jgi:hypothetical protein